MCTLFAFYIDIIQNVSERKLFSNFYGLILAMDRASAQLVPSIIERWLPIICSTVRTFLIERYATALFTSGGLVCSFPSAQQA